MHSLRFRQIHLDFHTSPDIEGIGAAFDREQWQRALRAGHVDSITTFAKCHHGWSYHPTQVGRMHPHLSLDLLGEQFAAAKEIDVNVPIYVSAGVDNVMGAAHPEWREMGPDGSFNGGARTPLSCGFHKMCFNSPYLDYLCRQIEEVVLRFPTCDGIFLDIINQRDCCCPSCQALMAERGLDPNRPEDRAVISRHALLQYYERTTSACRVQDPEMPVFHNSGHIQRGNREILRFFSHLELESLPTGGWGYDHFPLSAKYCQPLDLDFLGMTGKFHTTWGEFGGYKHPNALRYECAAMIAFGSKCSVGDQLHPDGSMDESTYRIVGEAYAEVEAKEPWCREVTSVADIGLISHASLCPDGPRHDDADTGACRVLLEGGFLFDVLDMQSDLSAYRMLVLPDAAVLPAEFKARLDAYLAVGGKLLLTGASAAEADGTPRFDIGGTIEGDSPFQPDFVQPSSVLRPDFCEAPMVMYLPSKRLKVTDGESLGEVFDPYFNRVYPTFCSHQHAPPRPEPSGYACAVRKGNVLYLAHPVFRTYAGSGSVALRQYGTAAVAALLGEDGTVETTMPSTGRVSLMRQEGERRSVLHLLYANTVQRGGSMQMSPAGLVRPTRPLEVIEELVPLHDVSVCLRPRGPVARITLEPQGIEVPFETTEDGLRVHLDAFACHQMLVLHDA